MRTKLLLLLLAFGFIAQAQIPIDHFFIGNTNVYSVMTAAAPLDQSASGANVTWNFSGLTVVGDSSYNDYTPTPAEVTQYPGTTGVIVHTEPVGVGAQSQLYYKNQGNTISITGISNDQFKLNYITNNALLGTFPLTYGYTNSDVTSGTYVYGTYSGTFTGTFNTSVDAYGTTNQTATQVTRLKTVQNISLNYGPFTNVGTATITTYSYYGLTNVDDIFNGTLVNLFATSNTLINVPTLGINENLEQIERYDYSVLSTKNTVLAVHQIEIAPNPVGNNLNLATSDQIEIRAVRITDVSGKTILMSDSKTTDVAQLQKGIYFVTVDSNKGQVIKKFVKK